MNKITQKEYLQIRKASLDYLKTFDTCFNQKKYSFLTCDKCKERFECIYAGSMYNVGGDCLAEK